MDLCLHQFQELQLYSGIITGREKNVDMMITAIYLRLIKEGSSVLV